MVFAKTEETAKQVGPLVRFRSSSSNYIFKHQLQCWEVLGEGMYFNYSLFFFYS